MNANATPFPVSTSPSKELFHLDLIGLPSNQKFLFYVLQGLVNRKRPRIWIKNDRYEFTEVPDYWKEVFETKGYRFVEIEDPWLLVDRFRNVIKGAVIYPEAIWNNPSKREAVNLTVNLCGLKDSLPLTHTMQKRLNLPVVFDVSPIADDIDAMLTYQETEILPSCSRQIIHHGPPGVFLENVDYLVAHRIFTFFVQDYVCPEKQSVYDRFLEHTDPVTPVIGVWAMNDRCPPPHGTLDELAFVSWLSSKGKYMIVTHSCGNLTVHAGIKRPELKQRRGVCPPLDRQKIYVCFVLSDGDNMAGAMQLRPRTWQQRERGQIPVGWNLGACLIDLCPIAAEYFYSTMTEAECQVAATTGYGYVLPDRFAETFDAVAKEKCWTKFMELNSAACKRMDMDLIWPWWCGWETAERYAKEMPSLKGVFLNPFPFWHPYYHQDPECLRDPREYGFRTFGTIPAIQMQLAAHLSGEP